LKSVAKCHELEFANRIHVLLGLKAVRLYGEVTFTRRNTKTTESATAEIDSIEDQDDDETLKELKSQKAASEQLLKEATKELNKCLVENNRVRSEKRQWKENPDDRDKHYRRVYFLKFIKGGLMLNVKNAIEQLQPTKREIDEHLHPASTTAPSPIIVNSKPYLHKADVCEACYSFRLCLILEDPMDTDVADEPECRKLPPTLTLGSKEINHQSGLATYTASLVEKKEKTAPGHQILRSKQLLSEPS
ncbi:hypothetical protein PS6_010617, partial [Mucor atramentarius]